MIYRAHGMIGLLIVLVTLARIFIRLRNPVCAIPTPHIAGVLRRMGLNFPLGKA